MKRINFVRFFLLYVLGCVEDGVYVFFFLPASINSKK